MDSTLELSHFSPGYFFNCTTLAFLDLVITGLLIVTILGLLLTGGGVEQFPVSVDNSGFRFLFTIGEGVAVFICGRGLSDITVVGLAPGVVEATKFKGRFKLCAFCILASFDLKKCGFLSIFL